MTGLRAGTLFQGRHDGHLGQLPGNPARILAQLPDRGLEGASDFSTVPDPLAVLRAIRRNLAQDDGRWRHHRRYQVRPRPSTFFSRFPKIAPDQKS